jgi:2C-methyl-D-erythritol 2,4-cyclodiphosphate synthase
MADQIESGSDGRVLLHATRDAFLERCGDAAVGGRTIEQVNSVYAPKVKYDDV